MKKIKIEIKNIFTGNIIFEYESENNTLKKTVEKAISVGANLNRANLDGANLDGANLYGANLNRASLDGASLDGANLYGANLYGANLNRASLDGANLVGASLNRASLDGAIKVPMSCKWRFGITDDYIHIGCEKRTINGWDEFFNSTNEIETKRNTKEFKQIEAVYLGLRAYYLHLNTKKN